MIIQRSLRIENLFMGPTGMPAISAVFRSILGETHKEGLSLIIAANFVKMKENALEKVQFSEPRSFLAPIDRPCLHPRQITRTIFYGLKM